MPRPQNLGEESGARRQAERSGNLDGYLDSMGAGDDTVQNPDAANAAIHDYHDQVAVQADAHDAALNYPVWQGPDPQGQADIAEIEAIANAAKFRQRMVESK